MGMGAKIIVFFMSSMMAGLGVATIVIAVRFMLLAMESK